MKEKNTFKNWCIFLIILLIILIAEICFYIYLRKGENKIAVDQNEESISNLKQEDITAKEIIEKLKEKNENIGKIVVYDEETDLNQLLGRPNQYISKVNFADNRIDQEFVSENDAKGGTIEVFRNEEDMKKRKEYIEQIANSASVFSQYIYSKGKVLMRIEKELTPTQAKEYEEIFNQIIK